MLVLAWTARGQASIGHSCCEYYGDISPTIEKRHLRKPATVLKLHIRDEVSSVTRPIKELRGFRRITLETGETKTVEFALGLDQLSFLNREMRPVVKPGTFKIMVGGNSVDLIATTLMAVPM